MGAVVPEHEIMDVDRLVQVVELQGDAGNILTELGEFLSGDLEQLVDVAAQHDHGVAPHVLVLGQAHDPLPQLRHLEAEPIFFQAHVLADWAADPLSELFPFARRFPFHPTLSPPPGEMSPTTSIQVAAIETPYVSPPPPHRTPHQPAVQSVGWDESTQARNGS